MDYYSEQSQNTPPVRIVTNSNTFLVFSIVFAVLAWMCSCFPFSTIVFGALSIIFAVLSKGSKQKMAPPAWYAVSASLIAMVLSTLSTIWSAWQIFNDPALYQEFTTMYEEMTGVPFEEELDNLKEIYSIPR